MPLASFLGPAVDVPSAPAAAPADAPSKRLAFSIDQPKPTEWCWAATAAAVASFYGQPTTPCQVATDCLGEQCCPEPDDLKDPRNREYALEGALRAVNHLDGDPQQGTIDFPGIVEKINAERPVCCHIAWDSTNPDDGHFNAIVGYDAANQDVDISDCLYGDQTLPYSTFKTAYQGHGTWDLTYLTT